MKSRPIDYFPIANIPLRSPIPSWHNFPFNLISNLALFREGKKATHRKIPLEFFVFTQNLTISLGDAALFFHSHRYTAISTRRNLGAAKKSCTAPEGANFYRAPDARVNSRLAWKKSTGEGSEEEKGVIGSVLVRSMCAK